MFSWKLCRFLGREPFDPLFNNSTTLVDDLFSRASKLFFGGLIKAKELVEKRNSF